MRPNRIAMHSPFRPFVRGRLAALGLALLLQGAAVWLIIYSLVITDLHKTGEPETQLVLLPLMPPPLVAIKPRPLRQKPISGVLTPYFNPYTFNPQALAVPKPQGLGLALTACDVGNYDMATDDIRAACDRIGALIKRDPNHFGFTTDITDPQHWQRELARRDAPYLAPCMSPGGINPLYTLLCIYDTLVHGYDSEKRARYSE